MTTRSSPRTERAEGNGIHERDGMTRTGGSFDGAQALETLADAVVAADSSNRIVYVNRAAEQLLGWPAGELVGEPLVTIQPQRLRAAHTAAFDRYFASRVPRILGTPVRVPALRRDGHEIEIELTLSAIHADGRDLVVASLRDLSERVDLERQLEVLRYLRASTLAATKLAASDGLDEILTTVVDTLVTDFDAALARVWLVDPASRRLVMRAAGGEAAGGPPGNAGFSEARLAEVAETRRPLINNAPASDAGLDPTWLEDAGVSGVGIFPLLLGGESRGLLVHFSRRPLREEVAEVLANFAAVVAAAIHDVELLEREHTAREEADKTGRLVDTLFATAPVGLAFWDRDFRYVRINESLAATNGLPPDAHIGRRVHEVLPGLGAEVADVLAEVIRTGEPILDVEISGETPAEPGRIRDWVARYFPVRGAGDELIGVGGVVTEVTERKRAQEALERSDERFRLLVDSVKDYAIFMHDAEGRIVSWNAGAERVMGYAADEIIGQSFTRFFPAEAIQADEPQRELTVAAAEGRLELEGWRVRRDGSRFWANVVITPLRDESGGLRGFSKVIRDVSDRRLTELRLKFLANASSILSGSLDYERTLTQVATLAVPELADWCAVHIVDSDGAPQQLALAHVDEEKVQLAAELQRRYPPDPNATYGVANVIRTGRSEFMPHIPEELLRRAARDDEHLEMLRRLGLSSYIIAPLVARGRTLGAITFVADGSGRVYGPADVAVAEDLARRAAAAVDNAALYRESQQAIGVRDEFLSLASHELRTPVTILHAYTQALTRTVNRSLAAQEPGADGHVTLDRARLAGNIEAMDHAIARLVGLVEDLLDVSRLQRGSLEIRRLPTDLTDLVSRVVDGFRVQQQNGRLPSTLTIGLELPDVAVSGDWDPDRLDQVLTNLVENAVKYSPPDATVTVSVALERSAAGDGQSAHVTVRDTGIGVPAAQQELVFQPYARGSNASTRNYPGFGMGLAVAREIIERLDGRIWVESGGEDAGSAFHVVLPGASAG